MKLILMYGKLNATRLSALCRYHFSSHLLLLHLFPFPFLALPPHLLHLHIFPFPFLAPLFPFPLHSIYSISIYSLSPSFTPFNPSSFTSFPLLIISNTHTCEIGRAHV